jgi:hypothetical protein
VRTEIDLATAACDLCGDVLEPNGTAARRLHLEVEAELLNRLHDVHGGGVPDGRSCPHCIALYRSLDLAIPRVTFSACCG